MGEHPKVEGAAYGGGRGCVVIELRLGLACNRKPSRNPDPTSNRNPNCNRNCHHNPHHNPNSNPNPNPRGTSAVSNKLSQLFTTPGRRASHPAFTCTRAHSSHPALTCTPQPTYPSFQPSPLRSPSHPLLHKYLPLPLIPPGCMLSYLPFSQERHSHVCPWCPTPGL